MFVTLLALAAGVGLLAYAADQLVIGAARVALIRNIPTLVVGVVIVGFGTSCPELLVSVVAAVAGLSGLLGPGPVVDRSLTVVAVGAALAVSVLAGGAMATCNRLDRWEGFLLVAAYAGIVPLLAG